MWLKSLLETFSQVPTRHCLLTAVLVLLVELLQVNGVRARGPKQLNTVPLSVAIALGHDESISIAEKFNQHSICEPNDLTWQGTFCRDRGGRSRHFYASCKYLKFMRIKTDKGAPREWVDFSRHGRQVDGSCPKAYVCKRDPDSPKRGESPEDGSRPRIKCLPWSSPGPRDQYGTHAPVAQCEIEYVEQQKAKRAKMTYELALSMNVAARMAAAVAAVRHSEEGTSSTLQQPQQQQPATIATAYPIMQQQHVPATQAAAVSSSWTAVQPPAAEVAASSTQQQQAAQTPSEAFPSSLQFEESSTTATAAALAEWVNSATPSTAELVWHDESCFDHAYDAAGLLRDFGLDS